MENITLSLWIIAMALQITFLVALTAIAQTLRRSNGICSPFGIAIFFCLYSLGQYADPFLTRLLTESVIAFAVPDSSISLAQLFSFFSSVRLIFILLAAFCLLALVLADLSHFWRGGRRYTTISLGFNASSFLAITDLELGWPWYCW